MIENARLREIATRDEGRYEGRAEGRKEGREEGKKEGRKEGLSEEQERITINLLKSGMSLEQIRKVTELNLAKLRELSLEIDD